MMLVNAAGVVPRRYTRTCVTVIQYTRNFAMLHVRLLLCLHANVAEVLDCAYETPLDVARVLLNDGVQHPGCGVYI
jgi:hypothetical protein